MNPNSVQPLPLRVAHFNSLLNGGGTDDQCLKLAHSLERLGLHVWLVGPAGRPLSSTASELIRSCHFVRGASKLRLMLAAAKLLRRERIHLLHGHHGRDLWPTIWAARLSGARPKVILSRHLAKSPSSWISRRFLLGQCDALIAVSEFVAKVLREGVYEPHAPEPERRARPPLLGDCAKIHVVYGGIDTERFRPAEAAAQRQAWGLAPDELAFAVVGGYDLPRGKGQREFLRAAAKIQPQVPHARFLIVGRGNMKAALEADIASLGLGAKARLTAYCSDMPAAMNAIDCLVHPQVGTEAFPGVVLEAFACGKPVIASRLDGIPEAFAAGGVGRLVEPESVEDLAEAMFQMNLQIPLRFEQRRQLHERIQSGFSLETAARNILMLYREVLG